MPGIGDSWGTREELLHPRDSHGRFRSKWKMSESVLNAVLKITQSFSPRTFTSDGQATQYTQNLAHTKPGRFHGGRGYARLQADFENANNDLLDGIPDEPSTKKFVQMMDESMIDSPDSFIASMVVGPDAFGLTPETLPNLEELTGNIMANRGYTAVNLGTPLGGGQGQITMSIAVPKGTKIAVPGRSPTDRAIYMNRDQELTITKVKPDGRGGYYVWAVATPATPGENPGPIGGHAGPGHSGNREADVKALEDVRMKRDMGQQGASQLPGGIAAGGLPEDPVTGKVIPPVPGETEADRAARERATRRAQVLGRPAPPAQAGPAPGTGAPAPAAPSVPAQRPSPDATPPAPTPAAPTPAPAAPTPAPAAPTPAPTPALPPGGAPPVTPQAPAAPSPAAPAADVPAGATAVVTGAPPTSFREALHSADIPAPSKMHRQSFNDAINGITSGKRQPADVLRDLDSDIEHAQKAQSLPAAEQGNVDTDIERMSKLAELIRSHFSLGAPKHTKTRQEVRTAIKGAEAARSKKMARPGGGSDRAPGEAPGTQMKKALQNARGGTPRKEAPKPKTTQQERGQKLLDIHAQNQLDDKLNAEQRQRWADAAGGEPAGMKGSAGDILLDETADLLRNGRVTRAKAVERLREHARGDQTPEAQYLHKVADQIEADTSKAAKRVPLKKAVKKTVDTATAEKSLEGRTPRNILTGLNGLDVGNMRALAESWGIDTRGGDKKLKLKAALAKELAQHWKDHPELQKGTPPAPVKKVAKAATKAAAPSVPDTTAPAVPAKKARGSVGTKLTAQERSQDRANAKKLAAGRPEAAPAPAPVKAVKAAKATKAAQQAATYDEKRAAEQKAWDDAASGVRAQWHDAIGAPPVDLSPVEETGLTIIAGDVASKKLSRPKAAARLRDVADHSKSRPETKDYLRKLADHLSTPAPRKKAVRTAIPAPKITPAKAAVQVANMPEVPAVIKKAAASAADRAAAGTAAGKITASRLMREDRILVTTNPAGEFVPAKLKRGANPLTVTSVHYGQRGRRTIKGHFGDGKEVTLKDVAPGQTFHAAETTPAAPALAAPTPAVPTPAVPTPAPKKVAKRLTGGAITDATPEDLVTAHAEGRISAPMARKELQRRADDLRQAANFQDSATDLPTSQGNKDRAAKWRAEADQLEAQVAGIKSTRAKKEVQAALAPAPATDPLAKVAEAVPSMPDTAPAIREKVKATKGPSGVSVEDRVAVHLMARIREKNPGLADEIRTGLTEPDKQRLDTAAGRIAQEAKRVKSGGPNIDQFLNDVSVSKPKAGTPEANDYEDLRAKFEANKPTKALVSTKIRDAQRSIKEAQKEMGSPDSTMQTRAEAFRNIDRQQQRLDWLHQVQAGLNGDGSGGGSIELHIDDKAIAKVDLTPDQGKTFRDATVEDMRKAAEHQGVKLPESATTKEQVMLEIVKDMARRQQAGKAVEIKTPTPAPAKPEPTLPKVTRDIKGDTTEGHSYRDTLKKLESGDLTPAAGAKEMRDSAKYFRAQAKSAEGNGHASPEARAALRDRHLDVARQYDEAAVEFRARKRVAKQAEVQAVLADVAAKAAPTPAAPEAPKKQPVTPLDLIHMSADDIVQAHADGRLTGKRAGGALRRKADNRATHAAFIGLGDKKARAANPDAAIADAEVARIRALADQVETRPGMVRPKKVAPAAPAAPAAPTVGGTLARATKSTPATKKAAKAAAPAPAPAPAKKAAPVATPAPAAPTPAPVKKAAPAASAPAPAPAPAKKVAPVAAKVETLTDVKQATKKAAAPKKAATPAPGHYTQAQLVAMEPSELRAIEDQLGLGRPSLAREDRAAAIMAKQAENAKATPAKKAAKKAALAASGPAVASKTVATPAGHIQTPAHRTTGDEPFKPPNGGADQGRIHLDSDIGQLWQHLAMDDRAPNSFVNEIAHLGDEMGSHRMSLQQVLDHLRQMEGKAPDSAIATRIRQTVDKLSAPPAGKLDLPADMPEKLRDAFRQFADIPTARMTASKDAHKRVGNETITPVSPLDKKLAAIKQLLAGDGSTGDIERALMNRDYHESADAATTMWSIMEKAVSDKAVQAWIRNTMRTARQKKGAQ